MAGRDARSPLPVRPRSPPGGALRTAPARAAQHRAREDRRAAGDRLPCPARGRSRPELAEHFVRAGDAGGRRFAASRGRAGVRAARPLERRSPTSPPASTCSSAFPTVPERWLGGARAAVDAGSSADRDAGMVVGRSRDRLPAGPRAGRAARRGDELGRRSSGSARSTRCGASYERSEALLEQTLALSGPAASTGLLTDTHEQLACSLFHQGDFDARSSTPNKASPPTTGSTSIP